MALGVQDARGLHGRLLLHDCFELRHVLPEYPAPGGQPIVDKILMELHHLLDRIIGQPPKTEVKANLQQTCHTEQYQQHPKGTREPSSDVHDVKQDIYQAESGTSNGENDGMMLSNGPHSERGIDL